MQFRGTSMMIVMIVMSEMMAKDEADEANDDYFT